MNMQQLPVPNSMALIRRLEAARDDLGKNGRRIATFFIENLNESAFLSGTEIARRCGVNPSSVVRMMQTLGFSGYKEFQAELLQNISGSINDRRIGHGKAQVIGHVSSSLNIHLLADSGRSFNEAATNAAEFVAASDPTVSMTSETYVSYAVDPTEFADRIDQVSGNLDGLILVAREHPAINEAVRRATGRGVPVICLTTDLPTSGRTAYVGSDQYVSGATAAWLCGRMLPRGIAGRVLFVYSVPFRCHQDREQGFRHVLRSEFPSLSIDEKVSSNESADVIFEAVRRYISKNGPPAALYNVSGANIGVGRALEAEGIAHSTIFLGHELNANSRSLLERGIMDIAIGHDFSREIAMAIDCIRTARDGIQPVNRITQSQVFTRFNCSIF